MSNKRNFASILREHQPISRLALLALFVFSSMANAAPISITFESAAGTWTNYSAAATAPYAPYFMQGIGTSAIYWGEPYYSPTGPQESLVFQGNSTETTVTPGTTAFAIGWLTHANNAIYGDTNITNANLSLQLSLAGSGAVNFNYNFDVFQDPNTYTDTLTFSPVGSTQFSLGGQSYSFNLLGFYNQGNIYSGIPVSDGTTALQNPLYASITAVPTAPVPAPAALWLLGSGLLGLAGFAKRKHAHQ